MTVLVSIAIALFVTLLFCLAKLRRLHELHHGYWGAAIVAIGAAYGAPIGVITIGEILLADDTVQHAVEALGIVAPFADFTPIHKLGAWLMSIDWKKQGWWPPVAIVALLAAAAIYSALHWGP